MHLQTKGFAVSVLGDGLGLHSLHVATFVNDSLVPIQATSCLHTVERATAIQTAVERQFNMRRTAVNSTSCLCMHDLSLHDLLCVIGADMRRWYADQQEDQEHADVQAPSADLQTGLSSCSPLSTKVHELFSVSSCTCNHPHCTPTPPPPVPPHLNLEALTSTSAKIAVMLCTWYVQEPVL